MVLEFTLSSSAFAQVNADHYFGVNFAYSIAEVHKSILGSTVDLLEPTGFSYFSTTWIPPAILINGELSKETVVVVRQILNDNPRVQDVYLDSPGGDLFAGFELGGIIASARLNAIVNDGAQCASACALAFLAAKERVITGADASSFGFHRQYYIVNGEIRYGSWKKDVGLIRQYLTTIHATSLISAEEIVGTTGLVTYSVERLRERRIITQSFADIGVSLVNDDYEPRTLHEYFRTLCHTATYTQACEQTEPEIDEPSITRYVWMQRAALSTIGQEGDGFGATYSSMTPEQFEKFDRSLTNAYSDNEFLYDCLKVQPSFNAYLEQQKERIERVVARDKWPDYEQTYQHLKSRCDEMLKKIADARKGVDQSETSVGGEKSAPAPSSSSTASTVPTTGENVR